MLQTQIVMAKRPNSRKHQGDIRFYWLGMFPHFTFPIGFWFWLICLCSILQHSTSTFVVVSCFIFCHDSTTKLGTWIELCTRVSSRVRPTNTSGNVTWLAKQNSNWLVIVRCSTWMRLQVELVSCWRPFKTDQGGVQPKTSQNESLKFGPASLLARSATQCSS